MTQPTAKTGGPRALAVSVAEELRKVTWPTRKDTVNLTVIVLMISLLIGAYIGIIDVLLTKGLELLTK